MKIDFSKSYWYFLRQINTDNWEKIVYGTALLRFQLFSSIPVFVFHFDHNSRVPFGVIRSEVRNKNFTEMY